MHKKEMQIRITRLESDLAYRTRQQRHIHSRMDLIEENLEQLKLYLDTLSALPAKVFDLREEFIEFREYLDRNKKGP